MTCGQNKQRCTSSHLFLPLKKNGRVALSRKIGHGRTTCPEESRTGVNAAFGPANHAWDIWPRDRRRAARSSGQSGRVTPSSRKILRPDAPKLRIIGE